MPSPQSLTLQASDPDPMLEFRVFGTDLEAARDILRREVPVPTREERTDVYFLGGAATRSFKLRDQCALDLKELVGHDGDWERWAPRGRCPLPADGEVIIATFPLAELPTLRPGAEYGPGMISVAFEQEGYRRVTVRKAREIYEAGEMRAEFARVEADGLPETMTLALEGPSVARLEEWRNRLGLSDRENMSYPTMLGRAGLT